MAISTTKTRLPMRSKRRATPSVPPRPPQNQPTTRGGSTLVADLLDGVCDSRTTKMAIASSSVLDWFVGDGGGHVQTTGKDWREAIDKMLLRLYGDAPETYLPVLSRTGGQRGTYRVGREYARSSWKGRDWWAVRSAGGATSTARRIPQPSQRERRRNEIRPLACRCRNRWHRSSSLEDVRSGYAGPCPTGRRFTLDVADEMLAQGARQALAYAFDNLCQKVAWEQRPALENEVRTLISGKERRDEIDALVKDVVRETVREWILDVLNNSPFGMEIKRCYAN